MAEGIRNIRKKKEGIALEDRKMVKKKKKRTCVHWKIEEWWKKKSCMRVGMKDRGMRKIIIFIVIKYMHVECVSGWMVCTYLYMYYNGSCVWKI